MPLEEKTCKECIFRLYCGDETKEANCQSRKTPAQIEEEIKAYDESKKGVRAKSICIWTKRKKK